MATNNNNPFGDFYSDMLEMDPQMAYLGKLTSQDYGFNPLTFAGQAPAQQQRAGDYFENQYSNIYNEYLGQQGRGIKELAAGGKPSTQGMQSFSEFLQGVPFTERYGALTPQQKGTSARRFAPATRHIYF